MEMQTGLDAYVSNFISSKLSVRRPKAIAVPKEEGGAAHAKNPVGGPVDFSQVGDIEMTANFGSRNVNKVSPATGLRGADDSFKS